MQIGLTLAVSGALSAARACWMEVLRDINKESASAAMNIGQSYGDERNFEEAVDWFTTALDLTSDADSRALCLYNRGIAFSQDHKYDTAVEDFLETIRLNPTCGMAYNNIGSLLSGSRLPQASRSVVQALSGSR
jgi:tetratricopeptide (TPR) repeat protein